MKIMNTTRYDYIDRNMLLSKLDEYGVYGRRTIPVHLAIYRDMIDNKATNFKHIIFLSECCGFFFV